MAKQQTLPGIDAEGAKLVEARKAGREKRQFLRCSHGWAGSRRVVIIAHVIGGYGLAPFSAVNRNLSERQNER